MKDWIPLINKLVWPVIIGIILLIFHSEVGEMYDLTVNRIKSGGSIESLAINIPTLLCY